MLATGVICASTTINAAVDPSLVADVLNAERKGGPGSVGHACEYETAMMLHLHPDLVQMDKARRDIGQLKLEYFNWDHPEPSAYAWQDWWSRFSEEGICGDAAAATAEFGQRMFEVTVDRFVEMAREFRTIPIRRAGGSSLANRGWRIEDRNRCATIPISTYYNVSWVYSVLAYAEPQRSIS